jgi:hypothetical protein
MKIFKTYLYLFGILLLITSCKGMNDNIEEYLDQGEINYLGRPNWAFTQSGNGRVCISWFVNDDPRIEGCTIAWNNLNNELQTASFPINRSALTEGYMSVIIPLEEGTYVFKIVHTGDNGYPSIATEVSGRVYGANYISTLHPRRIELATAYQDRIEISWAVAEAKVTKVLLTYETNSGNKKTVEVASSETKTILTDNKLHGEYFWITKVLEDNAFEELSVQSDSKVFPLPNYPLSKVGWTAYAPFSRPGVTYEPGRIIDGSRSTFWCSPVAGIVPDEPYYIQVDMQNAKHVTNIAVDERHDIRELEISSSINGNDWQKLGSLSFESGEHGIGSLSFDDALTMRYIRFTITGSSNEDKRGAIWEIDVTGYDD